jgi:hypothetical protein
MSPMSCARRGRRRSSMRRGVPWAQVAFLVPAEFGQRSVDDTAHPASDLEDRSGPGTVPALDRELESPQSGLDADVLERPRPGGLRRRELSRVRGHVLRLRERHPARGRRTLPAAPPFRRRIRGSRLRMRRAVRSADGGRPDRLLQGTGGAFGKPGGASRIALPHLQRDDRQPTAASFLAAPALHPAGPRGCEGGDRRHRFVRPRLRPV